MENSNSNHYDFMKLVIKDHKVVRKPQVIFPEQKSLAIKKPDNQASRIGTFKMFQDACVCSDDFGPIDTFGSFSNGFDDGFDI